MVRACQTTGQRRNLVGRLVGGVAKSRRSEKPRRSYANGGAVQSGYSAAEKVAEATTLAGLCNSCCAGSFRVTTIASQRRRASFDEAGTFSSPGVFSPMIFVKSGSGR